MEDDAGLTRADLPEAARLRAHSFDGERAVHHHGRQWDAVPLRQRLGDRVVDRHDLVRGTDEPMFKPEENSAELPGGSGELRGKQFMRVVEQRNPVPPRENHPGRKRIKIVGMVKGGGQAPHVPDGL